MLSHAHNSLDELRHGDHEILPVHIRHFAAAYSLQYDFWCNPSSIREYFILQGHKTTYVETVVAHVCSLADFLRLLQRQIVSTHDVSQCMPLLPMRVVDPVQQQFLNTLKEFLIARGHFYDNMALTNDSNYINSYSDDSDYDNEDSIEDTTLSENENAYMETDDALGANNEWQKYLLLTGKPGTGKTFCIHKAITQTIEQGLRVMVATPTGFLASTYSETFDNGVSTNTVHSAFKYPVACSDKPQINWDLMNYDVIFIDEASMLSTTIMHHIINTVNQISVRPIIVMCGDRYQQQPIETVNSKIKQVDSILANPCFYNIVRKFNLVTQFRSEDDMLTNILTHIRYYRPSKSLLETIHEGRVLSANDPPSDEDIRRALIQIEDSTFITVSRNASNRVNMFAIDTYFKDETPLINAQCDCEMPPIPIYRNIAVIITQNIDKENGVVNGQRATVITDENKTIILRLKNGKIVPTHLVTTVKPDGITKVTYPFVPGYAITICKSQGQTLNKVIIWFDCARIPEGAAYVALSRVRKLENMYFLIKSHQQHYNPVQS